MTHLVSEKVDYSLFCRQPSHLVWAQVFQSFWNATCADIEIDTLAFTRSPNHSWYAYMMSTCWWPWFIIVFQNWANFIVLNLYSHHLYVSSQKNFMHIQLDDYTSTLAKIYSLMEKVFTTWTTSTLTKNIWASYKVPSSVVGLAKQYGIHSSTVVLAYLVAILESGIGASMYTLKSRSTVIAVTASKSSFVILSLRFSLIMTFLNNVLSSKSMCRTAFNSISHRMPSPSSALDSFLFSENNHVHQY